MGPWALSCRRCLGCSADQVLQGQLCPLVLLAWPLNSRDPGPALWLVLERLRSWDAQPASQPTAEMQGGLPCVHSLQGWPRDTSSGSTRLSGRAGPLCLHRNSEGSQGRGGPSRGPAIVPTCRQDRSPLSSGQFNRRREGLQGAPYPAPNTTAGN